MNFHLAIISHKRPQNVGFMQSLCAGHICNWYVNKGEGEDYIKAGAHNVNELSTNICQARNYAIEDAFANNLPSIQISDDLRNIKRITLNSSGKRMTNFISVIETINELIDQLQKHKAFFGGVAINSNPLNYTGIDVSTNKLVVNDFICMMPSAYRFDEAVALKEDYDMCIRQLIDGNKIIRLNNILCDFPHRQNQGGANTYRNANTEDAATARLMYKWPNYIMPHRTRPGQISLDYKAIQRRIDGIEPIGLF